MNSPPPARPISNAEGSAPPAVDLRLNGALWRQITRGQADSIVARGWGRWQGTGRRRCVALTDTAPISSLGGELGGKFGTRTMRADGSGQRAAGQALGERKSHLELIPPTL
jgi:hypothetical protein